MRFVIHKKDCKYSLESPHKKAFKKTYGYINLETGETEISERWEIEVKSVKNLVKLMKQKEKYDLEPL